jgi:hypothetical protein
VVRVMARQAPGRRDSLRGPGSPATGRRGLPASLLSRFTAGCPLLARRAAGRVPGGGDRGRSVELADRLPGSADLPLFQSVS